MDPKLELEDAPAGPAPEGNHEPEDAALPTLDPNRPRGADFRARLLARVEAARTVPEDDEEGAPTETRATGHGASEAQGLGPASARRSPRSPRRPGLSPNLVAALGTLLGIAGVCSLVALAMRLDKGRVSALITPPPTASATAEPITAPSAPAPAPRRERVRVPGPWRIADDTSGKRKLKGHCGGAPFLKAATDTGVELKQAYRIITAMKSVRDLDKCGRNDEFFALVDAAKRVVAFEYVVSREEVYQAREGADGLLKAAKLDLKVEREQVQAALALGDGSVAASAERAGLDPSIDVALRKAFTGFLGLEGAAAGDRLRLIAQELSVLGEFARYAGVEAAEYLPRDPKERPTRIYYFNGRSERGYYDAEGRTPSDGGWAYPLKEPRITSRFNPKRVHPILKKPMPHTGTDFGAPSGTPVYATLYGTVTHIGPLGPCGNTIKIEHPGGIESGYCHLSRFEDGLAVGQKVKRLQPIGYVGTTGRSTGPHLHFFVKRNGAFFDAQSLNFGSLRSLAASERDLFQQAKARYDAALDAIALPPQLTAPAAPTAAPDALEDFDNHELAPSPASTLLPTPGAGPAAAAPAPAARPAGGPSIFLTDEDLLKQQGLSDDGESAE